MNLMQLFDGVKRKGRKGQKGVTTDQLTEDMVTWFNGRAWKFYRKWPWPWGRVEISFTQVAGLATKTLDAAIGDIIVLSPNGGKPLKPATWKQYYEWIRDSTDTPGGITRYMRRGRAATGGLYITFWKTPTEGTAITGWGKSRYTPITVADVTASAAISYFPEEVHDVLFEGLLADHLFAQNDARWLASEQKFDFMMSELIPEEDKQDEPDLNPVPDRFKWAKRKRGGTQVV